MAHVQRVLASDEPTIRVILRPPVLLVLLSGELDLTNTTALKRIAEPGPSVETVLVDLADLTFCDIAGFRALTEFRGEHLRRHRHFAFVHIPPTVQRLVKVAGVSGRAM